MKTKNLFSEKKNYSFFRLAIVTSLFVSGAFLNLNAQVTIGSNTKPEATLDVVASDIAKADVAEGVIAPRLTLVQLQSKNAAYKLAQNGAIVYVTDVTGTPAGKTEAITAPGYYYYDALAGTESDGSDGVWKGFGGAEKQDNKTLIISTQTPFLEVPLDVDMVVFNMPSGSIVSQVKMPLGSDIPNGKTVRFMVNGTSSFVFANAPGVYVTFLLNYSRLGCSGNAGEVGLTMTYVADLEKWAFSSGGF